MGFEPTHGVFVDLADPLAGQAKLFTDLSPRVVVEVNRKEYPLLRSSKSFRARLRNLSTASNSRYSASGRPSH